MSEEKKIKCKIADAVYNELKEQIDSDYNETGLDMFEFRPDLWENGIVYNFENGIYGMRYSGSYSLNSGTSTNKSLYLGDYKAVILDYGGWAETEETGLTACCNSIIGNWSHTLTTMYISSYGCLLNNLFTFPKREGRISNYDFWVKFKKI